MYILQNLPKLSLWLKTNFSTECRLQIVFADLEVEIFLVSRFLGGCIRNDEWIRQTVQGNVNLWVEGVEQLAAVARAYPQLAYCAFIHSLSHEWSFLQCAIGGYDNEYFCVCVTIQHVFTPAALGREVLEKEQEFSHFLLSWEILHSPTL